MSAPAVAVRVPASGPTVELTSAVLPYEPAVPAQWPPVLPSTVAQALDVLSQFGCAAAENTGTNTGTSLFYDQLLGNYQPAKSGRMLVIASAAVALASAADVSFAILVDGAPVRGVVFNVTHSPSVPALLLTVLTVNPLFAHNFGLSLDSSAVITCQPGEAQVLVLELGA